MARYGYPVFFLVSLSLIGAPGAWGDVGTAGQSAISPAQNGVFAPPLGPNQGPANPSAPLAPEPGTSQQPGQVPDNRLPQATSCAGGFNATPGFQCSEPGTLPGSIPSPSNSNMFTGKTNSPTTPGAP